MGRPLRLTYPRALHHVTMRCNNKEFLFDEYSQQLFLDLLRETCEKYAVPLYSYCLMTNHVHLMFQVNTDDTLSHFMHRLANVFAKRFNRIRERKGHLWEGRFVSTIVEPSSYFLRCMAYIDLNPVRARMVEKPGDYCWSSYRHLAAENGAMIQLHRVYYELGSDRQERHQAYLKVLREEAARKPYSLAGTLFVGSKSFTQRLQERFDVTVENRARFRRVELDGGLLAIERRKGGSESNFDLAS